MKELRIKKRLAAKLRRYDDQDQSSLHLIGKDSDGVITRIFELPDDGGCEYERTVECSSMTKTLLQVYSKRLIPAGFFYINTHCMFDYDEEDKCPGVDDVVERIYDDSLESMNYKFLNMPVIVVCDNNLFARYKPDEYADWLSLKIKEV